MLSKSSSGHAKAALTSLPHFLAKKLRNDFLLDFFRIETLKKFRGYAESSFENAATKFVNNPRNLRLVSNFDGNINFSDLNLKHTKKGSQSVPLDT